MTPRPQPHGQAEAEVWLPSDMVFTTDHGTPYDPRNFHRQFKKRSARTGVRLISVHTKPRTCASLLGRVSWIFEGYSGM